MLTELLPVSVTAVPAVCTQATLETTPLSLVVPVIVTRRPELVVIAPPAETVGAGSSTSLLSHPATITPPNTAATAAPAPLFIVWRREKRSATMSLSVGLPVLFVSTSPSV